MKKTIFYGVFLLIAFVILGSSMVLYFYFEHAKKNIHDMIFHRMLNEISSISENLKNDILKRCPFNVDCYEYLKTHPKVQKEIQSHFSLLSTHNIKFIYLLGVEKNNKLVFLADGSKTDRGEFGEIFEPLYKEKYMKLKPHYFFQRRTTGLYLTYITPITENKKLRALIVVDVPYNFLKFVNSILNDLNTHIYIIMAFSFIFVLILFYFAYYDYKREIEKEKLLEQLRKANEELEENVRKKVEEIRKKDVLILHQSKLASLGEMLTMIAHQWRQPLNSLSTAAVTLLVKNEMGSFDKKECLDFAKFVENQTQKLSEIIDDFMNLSKPTKEKEEFYLKEIIDDVLKLVEVQLKNHGITLEVDIKNNLKIKNYKKELSHVLINLITNARDALDMSKNEKKIIKIYTEEDEKYIKIIVEDNGGGIPEKIKDRIFEPYFTTKSPAKGTGIGLYMSKKIVEERLNGELYFENTTDGVRFIVKLKKEN